MRLSLKRQLSSFPSNTSIRIFGLSIGSLSSFTDLPFTITMIRNCLLFVAVCAAVVVSKPHERSKRQVSPDSYVLPSGAELVVGPIRSTFSCAGLPYGYYSDIDNDCKIFHVCVPVHFPDGNSETYRYSFFCGNQTYFDESQLTCTTETDTIACNLMSEWTYLNDFFGNLVKQFYPRKAIPDGRPQGTVDTAPNVERHT